MFTFRTDVTVPVFKTNSRRSGVSSVTQIEGLVSAVPLGRDREWLSAGELT
jgi:hypothetical protein